MARPETWREGANRRLEIRYSDFHTFTRSRTFSPTNSELEIYPIVRDLYDQWRDRRRRVRLVGIALSNLGLCDGQLSLFSGDERLRASVDAIRARFGFDAVHAAAGSSASRRVRSIVDDDSDVNPG